MDLDVKELLGWSDAHIEDIRFVGYAYAREGKFDIAQTFFEALHAIDPSNEYDAQTLGAILLERGLNEEARVSLEEALKLNPDHIQTILNYTKALFLLGRKDEAVSQAEKLKGNPNKQVASQAESLLLAYAI